MIVCCYRHALLPDCLFQLFSGQKHFYRTLILPSANMLVLLRKLCLWVVISDSKSLIYLSVWGTYCSSQLYAPSMVKMAAYNIGKRYYKSFLKFCFFFHQKLLVTLINNNYQIMNQHGLSRSENNWDSSKCVVFPFTVGSREQYWRVTKA